MRKIILTAAAIMFLTGGIAFADYKDQVQLDVAKALNVFYQVEQGNKLTSFSMRSLMQDINKIFNDNVVKPDKPKDKKKD